MWGSHKGNQVYHPGASNLQAELLAFTDSSPETVIVNLEDADTHPTGNLNTAESHEDHMDVLLSDASLPPPSSPVSLSPRSTFHSGGTSTTHSKRKQLSLTPSAPCGSMFESSPIDS